MIYTQVIDMIPWANFSVWEVYARNINNTINCLIESLIIICNIYLIVGFRDTQRKFANEYALTKIHSHKLDIVCLFIQTNLRAEIGTLVLEKKTKMLSFPPHPFLRSGVRALLSFCVIYLVLQITAFIFLGSIILKKLFSIH